MEAGRSERKTLCDLGMVTVDFGSSDAAAREPGNNFWLTFRHRNGQETGRIAVQDDVGHARAVQSRVPGLVRQPHPTPDVRPASGRSCQGFLGDPF
jgi:hypothetical protein